MVHEDGFQLEFKNYEELSYLDEDDYYVELFHNGDFVGNLKVYLDAEENDREYIIVNYEIIYLDTIKKNNYEFRNKMLF